MEGTGSFWKLTGTPHKAGSIMRPLVVTGEEWHIYRRPPAIVGQSSWN